jgi:hypothetical protein
MLKDPKVIKIASFVVAALLYACSDLIDPQLAGYVREFAVGLFAAQGFRRAGDLEPIKGGL